MPSSACPLTHPHLPPFPTRRSSDLGEKPEPEFEPEPPPEPQAPRRAPTGQGAGIPGLPPAPARPRSVFGRERRIGETDPGDPLKRPRSEEHTSELQSLRHLVCRLLLAPLPTRISLLSLHDALPISARSPSPSSNPNPRPSPRPRAGPPRARAPGSPASRRPPPAPAASSAASAASAKPTPATPSSARDRKSTRLNSSHLGISYAVFCLPPYPPASPSFPYTTLFRSRREARARVRTRTPARAPGPAPGPHGPGRRDPRPPAGPRPPPQRLRPRAPHRRNRPRRPPQAPEIGRAHV